MSYLTRKVALNILNGYEIQFKNGKPKKIKGRKKMQNLNFFTLSNLALFLYSLYSCR